MKTMTKVLLCVLVSGMGLCLADLEPPPGPPGSEEARMKSLNEIEPRKIINDLPFAITNSGSYYLGSKVHGKAGDSGIKIQTSDVQIDLGGFSLNGVPGSLHGITVTVPAENITIRNGVLRGWDAHGINASNASSTVVTDIKVFGSGWGGIYVGKDSCIERCTIAGGGDLAPGSDPPLDDAIQAGSFSTILDCKIKDNGGAGIHTRSHTRISRCTITENHQAEGVFAENYCIIEDTVCAKNGMHGIMVQSNCRVKGNTCGENGTNDVPGGAGIQVEGNNNVIEGNSVMGSDVGIAIPPHAKGNLVIRNHASGNTYEQYDIQGTNHLGEVILPVEGQITINNPWANFSF